MNLYLDIETLPVQDEALKDDVVSSVRPPSTLKKAESISAWERDERKRAEEDAINATSFDGGYGQVCVIGWAIDDGPARAPCVASLSLKAERELLCEWVNELDKEISTSHGRRPVVVGFNHAAFDLPFLTKRFVIHRIKPPLWFPRDPKPWSESIADVMVMWSGAKGRISMDRLCKVLGIPGKGDINGADVWPYVQAGRLDEVVEYCRGDVQRTRAIYQRLMFEPVPKWAA